MSVPLHQYLQYLFESGFPERELPPSLLVTSHSGTRAGWHQTNKLKSIESYELVLDPVLETNLKKALSLRSNCTILIHIYHSQCFKMGMLEMLASIVDLFLSDTGMSTRLANCPRINLLPRQFSKRTSEARPLTRQGSASICFADVWHLATNTDKYCQALSIQNLKDNKVYIVVLWQLLLPCIK